MHKVSQHMQNTKAQHQQRREKSHLEPSVPLRAQIEPDSAAKRRRLRPPCARANCFPQRNLRLPEKTQCFVQILQFSCIRPWCGNSYNAIHQQWLAKDKQDRKTVLENKYRSRSFGAAIPLRSAQTEWHNTRELQRTTVEHTALMHQFECTKYLNTCKAQKHSSNEEKKKWPGKTSLPLHAQIELDSAAQIRRLRPSRARANFSPQRNLRLLWSCATTWFISWPSGVIISTPNEFIMWRRHDSCMFW